ncbi:MAG: DUF4091 domain-containing protein [Clostridia bacterium]|nr:DUF4091 domain-containing protein [Clostridia bacterium]
MKYSLCSMNEWTYPDIYPEKEVTERINLKTVRGGSAGFQIRLTKIPEWANMKLYFTSSEPLGAEIFREISVNVPVNTGVKGFTADWETAKDYATRTVPFRVYDPIVPVGEEGFSANADEAIYVSFRPDIVLSAGKYKGILTIELPEEKTAVEVIIEIADALLPAETLKVTNWYSLGNMARGSGVEMWSEDHWKLIEAYGRAMRRIHQNVFWITAESIIISVDENEKYVFDFSRTERLIKLYLSLGFTTIEGLPLFSRETWEKAEFLVRTPKGTLKAMSPEGYEFVSEFLKAWADFLKRNGWYDITIQHVGDEPHESAAAEYRILSGIVRKFMPGIRIIEAVETYDLDGAVDIWVPKNDYYDRNTAQLEAHRAKGDEIWFYTCCIPGGHYANRLLDFPLIRTRMLHWGNFKYNLTGYLHWGLNHWHGNPYEDTQTEPVNRLPVGDTHILYPLPGPDGKGKPGVIGSMRAEMMKAGTEDYEMLRKIAKYSEEKADALCTALFRAFNDCDNTPEEFDRVHSEIIDALAEVPQF